MKTIRTIAVLVGAAALVSACGGGSNDVGKELGLQNPLIHFVHAIPSGPTVDFLVNGSALQKNIAYKNVTNFANINTGATSVSYAPAGTTTALASGSFPNVAKGHEYTVIAVPSASGDDIGLIDDPFDKGLLSGSARVRGFNASLNASNLDLYLVPSNNTNISNASPTLAGVSYKNAVPASGQDSVYVSGGTYVLIATAAGSKTPIFQSNSFDLANNADWLVTSVPIGGVLTQLLPNQIHLLVAQGGNTSQPALELTNTLNGQ
ncbi:DUF4397 domain-containing protein [Paraburkholderia phymatum]|uniref:Putative lipoprotein n=1 Tax=Paraburkholderia phymatum (strain DSM 17167 / CIP 108236 / LMG 21445 / STM815) TaxID=391038 RepID=B2JJF3_PARP8|nr:DUF4397 domain-containing protein [Paraburkholderia phymatum]ACC70696.1 putative lipoprotein [Paraburkholderia phymatum STM815]